MPNLRFVLSLITTDNDYQREQAVAGENAAARLGIDLQVIFADNDAITQGEQLLKIIQSNSSKRHAIACEPVSRTGLPQVANAAVKAGIAWAIVNRSVEYTLKLRNSASVPVFQVSADHVEVGRLQGQQLRALLPRGGMVLHIQGPTTASAAEDRTVGLLEAKPGNIQLRAIKADWTEEGANAAVSAWLRLSTSHTLPISAVVAQNDVMAVGARRAFENSTNGAERERWLGLPFLGCDGLLQTGQAWVHSGSLAATVALPQTAGIAIEMLATALRSGQTPPEMTLIQPTSYPAIERLTRPTFAGA